MSLGFSYLQIDIWHLTFEELFYMAEGQNQRLEEEYKNAWEQTRWLGFLTIQPHLGKGSKIRKATDLIRFPWEKKQKKPVDWAKIELRSSCLGYSSMSLNVQDYISEYGRPSSVSLK